MSKTVLTISRAALTAGLPANLDVAALLKQAMLDMAALRTYDSGSVGYNVNGKAPIRLKDGTTVKVQVGLNITVIGSKELPVTQADIEAAIAAEDSK